MTFKLEPTAEMLDENIFWDIVERSLANTVDQDDQESFLVEEISKLSPKEIVGFRLRTDELLYKSYTSEMWCASYIMNGGSSDDAFEYFRNWVISRGKDVYYNARENPDSLISQVYEEVDLYEFEAFWYVALEAFQSVTDEDLYDYIDEDNFHTREGNYPPIEFNWSDDDRETMQAICPRLYERFEGTLES